MTDGGTRWGHLAGAVVENAIADLSDPRQSIRTDAAAWIHSSDFALYISLAGVDLSSTAVRLALRRRGLLT